MGMLIAPVEITWPKGYFYLPTSAGIPVRHTTRKRGGTVNKLDLKALNCHHFPPMPIKTYTRIRYARKQKLHLLHYPTPKVLLHRERHYVPTDPHSEHQTVNTSYKPQACHVMFIHNVGVTYPAQGWSVPNNLRNMNKRLGEHARFPELYLTKVPSCKVSQKQCPSTASFKTNHNELYIKYQIHMLHWVEH